MSAKVLSSLLNELRKGEKMLSSAEYLSLFCNFNNTEKPVLSSHQKLTK